MKRNVLIIGAGGVARVVAHKCARNADALGDIHIASPTLSKCEAIAKSVRERCVLPPQATLACHRVDAMHAPSTPSWTR